MIKTNFELYAPIKGLDGLYEVSTWGNVRSLDRWITNKNGTKQFYKGRILKPVCGKDGYLRVHLFKDGKRTSFYVHRLVAKAFIPNPDNLPLVNHKDEVKDNNYPYNLEWCTDEYNKNYGTVIERMKKTLTNRKDMSKKVYQYDLEGNLIKEWDSTREAGRNNFNASAISACCLGKVKTHKGYIWSYKSIDNFDINNYLSDKKIYQYDLNGNLIKEWLNIKEASKNEYYYSSILKCCKGKAKTHKGYIWSYKRI